MEAAQVEIIVGLVIVVLIALFFILRQVTLWYFKINEMIRNQHLTNDLLQKIYIQQGGTVGNVTGMILPSDINEDDLGDQDMVLVKAKDHNETLTLPFAEWKKRCSDNSYRTNHKIVKVIPANVTN